MRAGRKAQPILKVHVLKDADRPKEVPFKGLIDEKKFPEDYPSAK
jgi:hypothetical protein